MGVSKKIGYRSLGGPYKKLHSFLGYMSGSPFFGKPQNAANTCLRRVPQEVFWLQSMYRGKGV